MPTSVTARARINLALVKYWGKRDARLNLPAAGSLSVTLSGLGTTSTVSFNSRLTEDRLFVNGEVVRDHRLERASRFLDIFREKARCRERAEIVSFNDVPEGVGLATSASAFASIGLAAALALDIGDDREELAKLVRLGSGSASRSLFSGFVEVSPGIRADGEDYSVRTIASPDHLAMAILVVVVSSARKRVGSREGMEHTRLTSPYYGAWLQEVERDLALARKAVLEKDFSNLGRIAQRQAFRLHGAALAAEPPLLYFSDVTIRAIEVVRDLASRGVECYVTLDAGPSLFVLCRIGEEEEVTRALARIEGVERVVAERPGHAAEVL